MIHFADFAVIADNFKAETGSTLIDASAFPSCDRNDRE